MPYFVTLINMLKLLCWLRSIREGSLRGRRVLLFGRTIADAPGSRGQEVERRALHRKEAMMADRVGQQFGNYRLVALLGQGGFAEVYLGQHVRLELQAAIKVLYTHLTGQETVHFQQEAETIATLMH